MFQVNEGNSTKLLKSRLVTSIFFFVETSKISKIPHSMKEISNASGEWKLKTCLAFQTIQILKFQNLLWVNAITNLGTQNEMTKMPIYLAVHDYNNLTLYLHTYKYCSERNWRRWKLWCTSGVHNWWASIDTSDNQSPGDRTSGSWIEGRSWDRLKTGIMGRNHLSPKYPRTCHKCCGLLVELVSFQRNGGVLIALWELMKPHQFE